MASIDIFLKSYKPDFQLLQFALKSITRHVTGYNNIILLIPEKDREDFDTRDLPARTLIYYIEDKSPGWLYQQVCKLDAHKYSRAEYTMFADSDCFFTRPINLQDYIADGRPEILYTAWDLVGDAVCWRKPTEEFMEQVVPFEFMRRNCLIYHRHTILAISLRWPDLEKTVMGMERFSEFNLLGAFAYERERENYNFINTGQWTYTPPKAEQVWSHARKESNDPKNLKEYIRTLETIMKSFGINPPE